MFRKLLKLIIPPDNWKMPVCILTAILVGLGVYTFYISNAKSYISDDPKTCINCHIMKPEFSGWQHSSHKNSAVCNDCHVPHNNFVNKYFFKARDGMRHAAMFTFRLEPQSIFMHDAGKEVVQQNCIRCHKILNSNVNNKVTLEECMQGKGKLCWQCHVEVPHGRVKSLSSVSYFIDNDNQRVASWLEEALKSKK